MLLHLEVGNAVAQKPAGLGPASRRHEPRARRARAAARRPCRQGPEPTTATFLPVRAAGGSGLRPCAMARSAIAHSIDLMVTGFSSMLSVQEASHGAGQTRPVTSGKIVGRMQVARRLVPVAGVDEVVPIGDLVVDRAARRAGRDRAGAHAIGHAAIHAARGLGDVILSPAAAARIRANGARARRPARSRGPRVRIRESR